MSDVSTTDKPARPFSLYLLILTQLCFAGGGLQGGWRLISDPTGRCLGLPAELLNSFPVHNFLFPGIFILTMFGLAPLVLAYALWINLQIPLAQTLVKGYHWAWGASVGLSLLLLLWTGILIGMVGYRVHYQLIDGLMALLMIKLQLLPSVRKAMIRPESP
ncbi:hypothetical protein ACFPMF_00050 [Larkinella bovis]|uniref:Uncharacterized protein n=1 Tax=Larkinella bovis TaxID=683041 RepID=A0ABW0I2F5_9BACT